MQPDCWKKRRVPDIAHHIRLGLLHYRMDADAPDLTNPASSSSPRQKMSVSDIFRDDLGKARMMPSWLSTQMFSMQESLDMFPASDPVTELSKHQLTDNDVSSDSSDDGLENVPEFLSGRYIPSPSISRFKPFLPRSSTALSPAATTGDDSDDDYDESSSKMVAEGDVTPHVELPVNWGGTQDPGMASAPLAPPLPAASEFAPAEDVAPAAPDALSKLVIALMDVQSRYLKALRLVERAYINVIRASHVLHRKPRLMNETEMTAAFVNWRDLVTIATELKRALRQGRQSAGENEIAALSAILNAIAAHIAMYGRIYLIFVSEFNYSTKSMEQIKKRREAFSELIELNEACDKRELSKLMSAPLHYMTELRDAIRRLNRSLAPEMPSTSLQRSGLDVLCARTYAAVARLDDEISRERALSEARSRVGQVQEFLFDGKVNLIAPGRYCVRYGVLLKLTNANKKDGKLLTFFLFNDLFLGADGKAGQMRVKYVLDLADLKATQTGPTTFHIESSVKSLLLSASNDQTAAAWIHDINEQVHGLGDRVPRPDPMALDALIRDDAKRLDATVAFSVRESHDLLTAKKEMTMVSMTTTMPEPNTSAASPMNAIDNISSLNDDADGASAAVDSMTLASSPPPAPTFKIHLTAAGEEPGLGIGMQGYLKMRGTTFSSLSSMFFVVNGAKQELNGWKLKADALKSAPKKTIPLKESVAFAGEFPEGAGLELYPADTRRAYVLIAPDATIRDAWCVELSKYRPPDRICEAFFEKRGGSDGQKPWRTRYFVMSRSRRSILYFNKRQDSAGPDWQLNATGSIDISDCHVERMECGEAMQVLDRRHVLELAPKSTERHFYLSSKVEAVLVQWIDEIRRLGNSTTGSGSMQL